MKNDVLDDILIVFGNLWNNPLEMDFYEGKKYIAWNGNSTNFISEVGINFKKLKHNLYKSDYSEVLNNLYDQLAINLQVEEKHIGRKGINKELSALLIDKESFPPAAVNFLRTKEGLDPTTYLIILDALKEYMAQCSRVFKKPPGELKRSELSDLELLNLTLSRISRIKGYYLVSFFNLVSPFMKAKWNVTARAKSSFNHVVVEEQCKIKSNNGVSAASIITYKSHIKTFMQWCCSTLSDFKDYTPESLIVYNFKKEHLEEYKSFLLGEIRRENRTANGAKQHLVYIKEFFSYLFNVTLLDEDIAAEVSNIAAEPFIARSIPKREKIQEFFDIVSVYSDQPLIEKAAYSVMLFLGLRLNEAASIKIEDINFGTRNISVKGKNGKTCVLPIPEKVFNLLYALKKSRRKGYLFSKDPKSFAVKLYKNFKLFKLLCGMGYEDGVHLLRHIYITHLSYTCSPTQLMELARHESERSTSFYLHRNDEEMTEAINKIFF